MIDPSRPVYAPILLPSDLHALREGPELDAAILSVSYGQRPLLRPLCEAARARTDLLLVDPKTAHFQFEGYMSMEDYRAVPYSPGRTTLGTLWEPRDFDDPAAREELVREVFRAQAAMDADLLLAPYFAVPAVGHAWFGVAARVAREALQYGADRPVGVVVAIEVDALLRSEHRDALLAELGELRPALWWLTVIGFDERDASPEEVRGVLAVLEGLQRTGAPTLLAYAGRCGLLALACGAAGYAAGTRVLEAHPKRFLREGLINLRTHTYYSARCMIQLPTRAAEAAAELCPDIVCEGDPRPLTHITSRRLTASCLRQRLLEVERLGARPAAERSSWLRDRYDAALTLCARAQRCLESAESPERIADGEFHYLEVLRELSGGPPATIPGRGGDL